MRNKFRDGLMSIWGHTEMELLPLTKSELLGKMAEISNIVNVYGYCSLKSKICPFASGIYCGFKTGENRIAFMKKCPLKEKKIRKERIYGKNA